MSLVTISFIINGCTARITLKRQETNAVLNNQKTLIILNSTAISRSMLGGESNDYQSDNLWYNEQDYKKSLVTENNSWGVQKDLEKYVIEPGSYSLTSIKNR